MNTKQTFIVRLATVLLPADRESLHQNQRPQTVFANSDSPVSCLWPHPTLPFNLTTSDSVSMVTRMSDPGFFLCLNRFLPSNR